MRMKKTIFLLLLFTLTMASAQPGTPGDGGGGSNVNDVVPIDGHTWIVLLLGVGLGLYHVLVKKSSFRK